MTAQNICKPFLESSMIIVEPLKSISTNIQNSLLQLQNMDSLSPILQSSFETNTISSSTPPPPSTPTLPTKSLSLATTDISNTPPTPAPLLLEYGDYTKNSISATTSTSKYTSTAMEMSTPCVVCGSDEAVQSYNPLVFCDGPCQLCYHVMCHPGGITQAEIDSKEEWKCIMCRDTETTIFC